MAQTTARSYDIGSDGCIVAIDTVTVTDDASGAVIAIGQPHRTPYAPAANNTGGVPTAVTIASIADAGVAALAATIWTQAVITAYIAKIAAASAALSSAASTGATS